MGRRFCGLGTVGHKLVMLSGTDLVKLHSSSSRISLEHLRSVPDDFELLKEL